MHLLHAIPGASGTLKLSSDVDLIERCDDLDDLDLWFVRAEYDVVLLDPVADRGIGRRWAQRYRARGGRAGLVFVVDEDFAPDLAIPLYAVCDDLVRLPVRSDEMLARAAAIVRRRFGYESATLCVGALTLDLSARRARYQGRDVYVSRTEFNVLETLMLRAGQAVTKSALMARLYQDENEPVSKMADTWVFKLRTRLRAVGAPEDLIQTVWSVGYRMDRIPPRVSPDLRSVA